MKYLLIMNPGSCGGKSARSFNEIFSIMNDAKAKYDYRITNSLEDACYLSREGNKAGYDIVVAIGGDGTLNRVLNGFYDETGQRISEAKMGVIYTGTSPDFCKSYGILTNVAAAVKILLKGQSKKIQIGKISLAKVYDSENDGLPPEKVKDLQTRYFACCANIGIGASLARNANSGIRKITGDYPGTFLALMKTLAFYKPCDYDLCVDGEFKSIKDVHSISIGRTYHIASGIKVDNALKDGDGHFYNLTVRNLRLLKVPGVLRKMYSGKSIQNGEVVNLSYGKAFEIYGSKQNPEVEFDGDPAGFLPCRIEMARDELDIICGDL